MSNIINRFREKDQVLFAEVEKLKSGDTESFTTIYELSKNYIYKIIWDIVKSQDAADDIMQETYLQIYNKVSGLADVSAFYSWAGRIATNFCLTYIKREKKYVLAEADESGEEEDFIFERASDDHEAMIPESIIMDREQQKIIADILDSLSTEQKLCVQYYYFEELSVKEIAEIMETSEGTIKSRLNYARKSIKSAVENIERRDGTKLYSIGGFPLLFLIFREGADILFGAGAGAASAGAATGATVDGGEAGAAMDGSAPAENVFGSTMNSGETAGTAGTTVNGNAVTEYAGASAKTAGAAAANSFSIGLKVLLACVATTVVVGGSILIFSKDKDTEDKNRIEEKTEYHIDNSGAFDVSDNNTEEPTSIEMTEEPIVELTDDQTEEMTEATTIAATEDTATEIITEVASENIDAKKKEDYDKGLVVLNAFLALLSNVDANDIMYSNVDDPNNYVILRVDPLDGGGAKVSVVSNSAEFITLDDSESGVYTIDDCLKYMCDLLSDENIMLEYTKNGVDCYYIYYMRFDIYIAIGKKDIVPVFTRDTDEKITVTGAYRIHPYVCDEYNPF